MPDLDYLKNLLGDEALAVRFLDLFCQQMPVQLADLQQYIGQKDWENAGAAAHAIKGQLRYLAEEPAAQLAYRIEQMADESGRAEGEAARLATDLKTAVDAILQAISGGQS